MCRGRLALLLLLLAAAGCLPQKMAEQPRYDALQPSSFFDDGKSARDLLPDVVARGEVQTSPYSPDVNLHPGGAQQAGPAPTATREASGQPTPTAGPQGTATGQAAPTGQPTQGTPTGQTTSTGQATPGPQGTPIGQVTEFPFPVTMDVLQRGQERFNIFCSPCHSRTGDGNGMIVQRGYPQPPSYHTDRLRNAPPGHFVDVITNGFGRMPSYADQVPVPDRWAITAYIRALQLSENATLDDVPPDAQQELQSAGQ